MRGILALCSLLGVLVLTAGTPEAATLAFPGPAPCNGTLQDCIDAAAAGDTIEIVTNTPIDENLDITRSLTLVAGSGFSPRIGGGAITRTVRVSDMSSGTTLDVALHRLTLDPAVIDVDLSAGSGHRFTLTDSTIASADPDPAAVAVGIALAAPGTVLLSQNTISSTGRPIRFTSGLSSGSGSFTALANRLTASDSARSRSGIEIELAGAGTIAANVYSNVIHGVGGCDCGGAGIQVLPVGTAEATVNIVNNTLDDIRGTSAGILVDAPTASGDVTVNIYNTIVTRAGGAGLVLPALSPGLTVDSNFNDFFGNGAANDAGGYPEGPSTFDVDPLYENAAAADYRLRQTSPVVNDGTNTPPGGLPDIDAAGEARVSGGRVDLGAHEFSSSTGGSVGGGSGSIGPGAGAGSGGGGGCTLNPRAGFDPALPGTLALALGYLVWTGWRRRRRS